MASKAQIIDFLLAGYRTEATDIPLNAGTVTVTDAGTANVAYVWDDRDKTLPTVTGRSTVTLDAYGKAEVYGDGIYKFVIKDSAGSEVETIDYYGSNNSLPSVTRLSGIAIDWDAATDTPTTGKVATWDGMPTVDVRLYGATGDGVTDDTAAINTALAVGGNIYFPKGVYQIDTQIDVSVTDTRLTFAKDASLLFTTAINTPVLVSAAACTLDGIQITAPAVFDGTNVRPTYACIKVTGKGCTIQNMVLSNVPKVGVLFEDADNGRVFTSKIFGGTSEGFFTGINTGHFGVYINPPATGSQGNYIVSGNLISACVQGASSGNYDSSSYEQAIAVTGNVFENCWNHGWYSPGFADGVTVTGNAFNGCQIPVALTGVNHVVSSNTMIVQTTGAALATDQEITGISLRDPVACVVSNNTIRGEGTTGGVVIDLKDNSGVAGENRVSDNVVSGNTIEITNVSAAGVACIRLDATSTYVSNNIISGNIIKAPVRSGHGLIHIASSASALSVGNIVTDNSLVFTEATGDAYGIYIFNVQETVVKSNNIRLQYSASVARVHYMIGVIECLRTLVDGNILRCPDSYGTNITLRGIGEITSGVGNVVRGNLINLDPTLLTAATEFTVLTTSGIIIDHVSTGDPEAAITAGVGSTWRRTDGGAGTTLYIKESGTSNTGWAAK